MRVVSVTGRSTSVPASVVSVIVLPLIALIAPSCLVAGALAPDCCVIGCGSMPPSGRAAAIDVAKLATTHSVNAEVLANIALLALRPCQKKIIVSPSGISQEAGSADIL